LRKGINIDHKGNNKYVLTIFLNVPVDPVCGIELDEELATTFEYNNKKLFFCCEGCKRIFQKKPKKYNK
jgi:YHS domain-containing protein